MTDQRVPGCITGYVRRFWQVSPPNPREPSPLGKSPSLTSLPKKASEDHRGTPTRPGLVATLVSRAEHAALRHADPHAPPPPSSSRDEPGDGGRRGDGGERGEARGPAGAEDDDDGGGGGDAWCVWGAAYRVPARRALDALAALDVREQNGYATRRVRFVPAGPDPPPPSLASSAPAAAAPADGAAAAGDGDGDGDGGGGGSSGAFECLVYIGTPANPQFVGPGPLDALARRVLACRGPSGENREYVYMLEEALRGLVPAGEAEGPLGRGALDEHVRDLAARCRELEDEEEEEGKKRGLVASGTENGGVVGEGEHADDVMEEAEVKN
jgi:cation transport regulator ChaC